MQTEVVLNTSAALMSKRDGLPPITCSPQRNLRSPAPPCGASSLGDGAIYGEAMNTIAKVAVVAVIVLFTVLLLWGLWMQ